jgi:hypothetical protein
MVSGDWRLGSMISEGGCRVCYLREVVLLDIVVIPIDVSRGCITLVTCFVYHQ